MVGARVYEGTDFEAAIQLISEGKVDPQQFVTSTVSLPNIGDAFRSIAGGADSMKALVACGEA